ncbi:MAG: RnfABCDGE type electron transport complex subunit D [Deltaproteobacteria bacterium]|jgi:electron transport complex protein RnfD|nr:RnfABCDGE type electron transport complex subunit D [Deltaproteobacteria bacterium]
MSQVIKPVSLAVAAPAFWHSGRTTALTMRIVLAALAPAAILAVLHWGFDAVRVMALSVSACVMLEALCQKMMDRPVTVDDFSAVVEGLLLAFLLPAAAPWWLVIIGAALTVLLGKMVFGGLGATPLCAPLVGWGALTISWPLLMDPNAAALVTMYTDPLVRLKYFGAAHVADFGYGRLFLGEQVSALGAGQAGAVLLGGLYLAARGIRRWEIPAAFLAGAVCMATVFYAVNPQQYADPVFHLLTGSTLLAAFFLATDPSCSPNRLPAMLIYGFVGGCLVILIRVYGTYTDGAPFAVLLINLLTPQLANMQPKPFGAR